jgi:hypothetical protein
MKILQKRQENHRRINWVLFETQFWQVKNILVTYISIMFENPKRSLNCYQSAVEHKELVSRLLGNKLNYFERANKINSDYNL